MGNMIPISYFVQIQNPDTGFWGLVDDSEVRVGPSPEEIISVTLGVGKWEKVPSLVKKIAAARTKVVQTARRCLPFAKILERRQGRNNDTYDHVVWKNGEWTDNA